VLRRNARRIDVRQNGTVVRSISLDPFEGFIHWMTRGKTGDLFVSIGSDVYRVPGATEKPIRMASDLVQTSDQFSFARGRHATMGMWTDAAGNVFVTVFAGQRVKRISPDGAVTTVYRSPVNWSPTGGLVAPDGSLWILEYSTSNQVRVRRLGTDGSTRVF
jgi:sugar lactone lactonase YvrE